MGEPMKKAAWLYLAVVVFQALHSLEEVITDLWRWLEVVTGGLHTRNAVIPVLRANGEAFLVANIVIVAAMLFLLPWVWRARRWALRAAWWAAVIEILNGTGHLAAAAVRGYFPGALTAGGLLILGTCYVWHWRLVKGEQR
jgi:hypothetical protein